MRLFIKIVVGFVILVLLYLGFVGIYFKYFYYKKDIDGITICTCIQDFMHTQEKEYRDNYYHLIEQSLKKDKKSLKELSLYDLRGATGESAYDHGDVLAQLLDRLGEDFFLESLDGLSEEERGMVLGYLDVGFEYGVLNSKGKVLMTKDLYPRLYHFLDE